MRKWQWVGLWLLAAIMTANGIWMVGDPQAWYHTVPGVQLTGPPNSHFVQDIGIAFLTVASAYLAALRWQGAAYPLSLIAGFWLTGHALIHLIGLIEGSLSPVHLVGDAIAIFGPAIFAVLLSLSLRRTSQRKVGTG